MPEPFTNRFNQAMREALAQAIPDPTPSGSHRILVVGQIVVNMPEEDTTPRRCKSIPGKDFCCGGCHS